MGVVGYDVDEDVGLMIYCIFSSNFFCYAQCHVMQFICLCYDMLMSVSAACACLCCDYVHVLHIITNYGLCLCLRHAYNHVDIS